MKVVVLASSTTQSAPEKWKRDATSSLHSLAKVFADRYDEQTTPLVNLVLCVQYINGNDAKGVLQPADVWQKKQTNIAFAIDWFRL